MEVKQINQLMLSMGRYGVKRLTIKREDFELQLEREEKAPIRSFDILPEGIEENPMRSDFERHRSTNVVAVENPRSEAMKKDIEKDDDSLYITSPMVGTFYQSPSPQDPAFIKPGDRVEKNTVVCIIEAMKVMNEVKAGVAGIVAEILVDNTSPIEFGTKLFRVLPS